MLCEYREVVECRHAGVLGLSLMKFFELQLFIMYPFSCLGHSLLSAFQDACLLRFLGTNVVSDRK